MSAMEVGTEISQKIRSAIKAKLLELGSYVDDELPDYIMVMVANKKTRAQMNGDLGLFLGTSTVAFTDWLHGLLEKLQTIRIEPEPLPGGQDKGENPKSKEKKRDKKSHKGESSVKRHKDKKKESENAVSVSDNGTVLDSIETRKRNSESREEIKASSSIDVNSQSHESEIMNSKSIAINEDFEDVRQLLVIGAAEDELTNELDSTEVEITHTRTVKNAVKPVSTSSGDATMASTDRLTSSQSPERRSIQKKDSEVARKRKAPTSIVASINQNSEDEEYDPRNPAVGSVASVVRVTARKSSIPLPLQANRYC